MRQALVKANGRLVAVSGLAAVAGIFLSSLATPARAYDYIFHETSSSLPGLTVAASIEMDGLPTLDNSVPGPYDFGSLFGFDISIPAIGGNYTLADFTEEAAPEFEFPYLQWSISPDGIQFTDSDGTNHFEIAFGASDAPSIPSTISFVSDDSGRVPCTEFGVCSVTGNFIAEGFSVPEPAALALLGVGLVGLGLVRRRT